MVGRVSNALFVSEEGGNGPVMLGPGPDPPVMEEGAGAGAGGIILEVIHSSIDDSADVDGEPTGRLNDPALRGPVIDDVLQ